jgi:hypothetical protein
MSSATRSSHRRNSSFSKRLVTTQAREQELRALMERSETGAGGATVNLFVYQPEYQTVNSELQQLRDAQVEKDCHPEPAKADVKPDGRKSPKKGDTGKTRS